MKKQDIDWKKILKIVGIIALVIIGIIIIWHIIVWLISLVEYLFGVVVAEIEWIIGFFIFVLVFKALFGGKTTSSSTHVKKPFFLPSASDNIKEAKHQVHDARDDVADSRDYVGHLNKNERDRRRW